MVRKNAPLAALRGSEHDSMKLFLATNRIETKSRLSCAADFGHLYMQLRVCIIFPRCAGCSIWTRSSWVVSCWLASVSYWLAHLSYWLAHVFVLLLLLKMGPTWCVGGLNVLRLASTNRETADYSTPHPLHD